MPLRAFALTIDRNLMHGAEVADAQLGPAISFGRAYSEPVENGGDAVVRQHASQFTDQLHGLHVGLPAILPSTVLDHFKPRVIPALPMPCHADTVPIKPRAFEKPLCERRGYAGLADPGFAREQHVSRRVFSSIRTVFGG